jgi:putative flippase GtrA
LLSIAHSAIRYGLAGLINTALGFALIYASMLLGAPPLLANALGFAAGLAASFLLNHRWTFQSRRPARSALPRFLMVTLAAFLANLFTVFAAIDLLGINPYLAQASGLAPYLLIGYLGARHYAFSDHAHST